MSYTAAVLTVGVMRILSARMASGMPRASRSAAARVASGVTSRGEKPVPPVLDEDRCCVDIRAEVRCDGRTGVEMEALTAVSAAALTVYDMCKAVQRDMVSSPPRPPSGPGQYRQNG